MHGGQKVHPKEFQDETPCKGKSLSLVISPLHTFFSSLGFFFACWPLLLHHFKLLLLSYYFVVHMSS